MNNLQKIIACIGLSLIAGFIVGALVFSRAPVDRGAIATQEEALGGGSGTVDLLEQFKSTSSPYSAITTRIYGKDLYLPGSHATTGGLSVLGINTSGATRCVNVNSSGDFGVASADCGTGAGGGASFDWQKETNYNTLTLTPTTTLPVWLKAALYASSSAIISGQVMATTGLTTVPSYSFAGDTNTGFFRAGADHVRVSVGGTSVMAWNTEIQALASLSSSLSNGFYLQRATGAATPPYSFVLDEDTGFYNVSDNIIGVSAAGAEIAQFKAATSTFTTGIDIASGCFAIGGTCVGGGTGTNLTVGNDTEIPFSSAGDFAYDSTFTFSGGNLTVPGVFSAYIANVGVVNAPAVTLGDNQLNVYFDTGGSGMTLGNGTISDGIQLKAASTTENDLVLSGALGTLGNVGIGTSSPYAKLSIVGPVVAEYFYSTSTTATSTFGGFLTSQRAHFSGSATNTASQGWNITSGCYAINGTCVGGGSTVTNTNDWIKNTNFNALALTPSTTIPVWLNGALYASSTAVIDGNVGIGTVASAKLHSLGTTEQLRLGYDASNYYSTTVNAAGAVTLNAIGTSPQFTISDQITQNYAPGTYPAGVVRAFFQSATGAGDSGGTTNIRAFENQLIVNGTNNTGTAIANAVVVYAMGSAGTLTNANAFNPYIGVTSAMGITNANYITTGGVMSGSGNIGALNYFLAGALTFSSTSDITGAITGINLSANIGRAAATTITGVNVGNQTKGSGNAIAYRGQMAAATNVWNLYMDGTAQNYLNGSFGIGSTTPYAKLAVVGQTVAEYFTSTSTSIASVFPRLSSTNATSTNLDVTGLLTFNGVTGNDWTDFCTTITGGAGLCDGTDDTGAGGGGAAASSTASYIMYRLGSTYYAYNASTTAVTSNADFSTLLQATVDTLDSGAEGGIIHLKTGDYFANATTTILGNDLGSTDNGGRVTIQGEGTDGTRIILANNMTFLDFDDAAIFSIKNLSVYVKGNSTAFFSDSNANDTRALWQFEFENIHVAATTTHTGYGFNLGNAFRGTFENIEMFELHNCARFHAEGTFNPGDFTWNRSFCELDTAANAIAYQFTAASTGFINQVHFLTTEAIAQGTGAKFIYATDLYYSLFDDLNAEQFDVLVDQEAGSSVEYNFSYTIHRAGVASLRGCRFWPDAAGNSCNFDFANSDANYTIVDDMNAWGDTPNIITGYLGADAGTVSASTSGTTIFRDIKGYGTLDTTIAPGGRFGIFGFWGDLIAKGSAAVADFSAAVFTRITTGSAPVISNSGQIAYDTTDQQFLVGTSTANYPAVIPTIVPIWSRSMASTSIDFVSGGRIGLPIRRDGFVIKELHCWVEGGTSVVLNIDTLAGGAQTDTITCDADGASDVAMSANYSVAAGALMVQEFGTVTGTVDYVHFTAYGTYIRE